MYRSKSMPSEAHGACFITLHHYDDALLLPDAALHRYDPSDSGGAATDTIANDRRTP